MAPNYALAGFRTIAWSARTLPRWIIARLCGTAAALAPAITPQRRQIAERNLERSTGRKLQGQELKRGVRAVFGTYARYWTDSTRLPTMSVTELDQGFTFEGFEHIEASVAAGKGTILVLAHLGGFEYAGSWLARVAGFQVTAVVERLENDAVREFMHDWRSGAGMQVVPLDRTLGGELVRRLRANHVVCLMSDRNLGDGGVEVDFFGETTQLPAGAATLALRTGARIVPVAIYHDGPINHAVVETPVATERLGGRLGDDALRITQAIAHRLEAQIRRHPTQWMLLQPNWPSDSGARL